LFLNFATFFGTLRIRVFTLVLFHGFGTHYFAEDFYKGLKSVHLQFELKLFGFGKIGV